MLRPACAITGQALLGLSLLIGCVWLSWQFAAASNYHYARWYAWLDIAEHVAQYAPQIPGKRDYPVADSQVHLEHFEQIARAVHNSGEGLTEIRYFADQNPKPLLSQAEVIHLQDVANLIDFLTPLAAWLLPAAVLALLLCRLGRRRATIGGTAGYSLATLLLIAAAIAICGAEAVFYQLHEWVFPAGHQWFFYYQESLMSTLMKAPVLFAGIAADITLIALLLLATTIASWQFIGSRLDR